MGGVVALECELDGIRGNKKRLALRDVFLIEQALNRFDLDLLDLVLSHLGDGNGEYAVFERGGGFLGNGRRRQDDLSLIHI